MSVTLIELRDAEKLCGFSAPYTQDQVKRSRKATLRAIHPDRASQLDGNASQRVADAALMNELSARFNNAHDVLEKNFDHRPAGIAVTPVNDDYFAMQREVADGSLVKITQLQHLMSVLQLQLAKARKERDAAQDKLMEEGKRYKAASKSAQRTAKVLACVVVALAVGFAWQAIANDHAGANRRAGITSQWVERPHAWQYAKKNGEIAKGWFRADGSWYYADDEGVMQTGWVQVDDEWYYLGDDGKLRLGWQQINGNYYFFRETGEMVTNEEVDGYYLGPNGAMVG
jgi:hypothetical protein